MNQIPVKDKGEGFIEYHQSFYKDGWFVYIWDAEIRAYLSDRIERCKEDAQLKLERVLSKGE